MKDIRTDNSLKELQKVINKFIEDNKELEEDLLATTLINGSLNILCLLLGGFKDKKEQIFFCEAYLRNVKKIIEESLEKE